MGHPYTGGDQRGVSFFLRCYRKPRTFSNLNRRKHAMPRDRSTGMWLYGTAVALAAVLTFEMVYQADAFGGVHSPSRYVRLGVEYSLLTVLYFLWLFRGVVRLRGPDRGEA